MSRCYWMKHSKKLWAWERKQEMPFAYLTPTPFWPILICNAIIWVMLDLFPSSLLPLRCLITPGFLISSWPSLTGFVDHWIIVLEVGWGPGFGRSLCADVCPWSQSPSQCRLCETTGNCGCGEVHFKCVQTFKFIGTPNSRDHVELQIREIPLDWFVRFLLSLLTCTSTWKSPPHHSPNSYLVCGANAALASFRWHQWPGDSSAMLCLSSRYVHLSKF